MCCVFCTDGRQVGWLGKSLVEANTIQANLDKVETSADPTEQWITILARTFFMIRWAIENYRIILKFTKAAPGPALVALNKRAKSFWLVAIALTLINMIRTGKKSVLDMLFVAGDAAAALHVSEVYPTNDGVVGVCGGLTALKQAHGMW